MADAKKTEAVSGWPVASGDYYVGNPEGCVAICTLSSETFYKDLASFPEVAIAGPCKTENIGLEKIVVNVIANSNIRFLILCGVEVTGHITGGSFKALYEKGIDPSSKRIKDAPGAIPYVEHLTVEAVERFKNQVTFIDMLSVEDVSQIKSKVEELVKQNPSAYPEPPFIVKLEEEKREAVAEMAIPLAPSVSPSLATLEATIDSIRYKVQLIGRERRLTTAVIHERGKGITLGLIISLSILTSLLLIIGV